VLGPRDGKQMKSFARVSAVGIELALSIVIGLLFGRWLDGKLGTDPWLAILGLVFGTIAGFRSLIQTVRRASREIESKDEQK
jgi:ATP synthase protein I